MIDVGVWTGREAHWLRTALRMSQRDFAALIGVVERTIAKWDSQGTQIRPRSELQRMLDTVLEQAQIDAQERFRALREEHTATREGADSAGGARSANAQAFALQPTEPPTESDGIDVAEFYERLMVDYVAFDNSAGPRPVVDMITRRATALAEQMAQTRGTSWVSFSRVACRYAEFAGWLHQDAGDPDRAARWTEMALSIAHASGDDGMVAYTLMRRSNQAAEQAEPGMALGLADAVLNSRTAHTPRIRALGHRQRAASLAFVGDRRGSVDSLARARDAIQADPAWDPLTGYCTIQYLDAEAALCLTRLDRAEEAVELLVPAIASWPEAYARDKGFYQAHLAEALALAGEADAAFEQARQAGKLVAACGSRRTAAQVHRVPIVLDAVERHRAATELRHELATVMV